MKNIAGNGGCIASSPRKPERFFGVSPLTVTTRHRVAALRSLRVCRISSGGNLPKHVVVGDASRRGPPFPLKRFEGILSLEQERDVLPCPAVEGWRGGLGGARWIHIYERGSRLAHESKSKQASRERERARSQEGLSTPTCRRRKPAGLPHPRPR